MEFAEIIKTINRMPAEIATKIQERMRSDPDGVERDVAAWAKDNPAPRYPTWGEWLCEVGVSRISSYEHDKPIFSRTRKFYEEMDPATAKMLGIEPKPAQH